MDRDNIFWHLGILGLLLPFILLYIGAYLPIIWNIGLILYSNWIIATSITLPASAILWWKKRKILSATLFIITMDLIVLGFLVYEISLALISEY